MLYYIMLYNVKWYNMILYYIMLFYFIILYYIMLFYFYIMFLHYVWYYLILYYITLYYIILHYITLYYIILHYITLYYIIYNTYVIQIVNLAPPFHHCCHSLSEAALSEEEILQRSEVLAVPGAGHQTNKEKCLAKYHLGLFGSCQISTTLATWSCFWIGEHW